MAGCAILALAAGVGSHTFTGHMVRHLLIGMVAPLALILGAPITLLLRSLPAPQARIVVRALRTPAARWISHPVTALTRAHDLLTDAVNELTEALLAERDELDPLRGTGTTDTESMRMAMRGYREFLDRILSL